MNRTHAMCSVAFDAGAPVFVGKSVGCSDVSRVEGQAAGAVHIRLDTPIDALSAVAHVTCRGSLAASGMVSLSANFVDDDHVDVWGLQEAAVGGASVLTDIAFDLTVERRTFEAQEAAPRPLG